MNWRQRCDLAISLVCLVGAWAVLFGWQPSDYTVAFAALSGCGRAWWVSAMVNGEQP